MTSLNSPSLLSSSTTLWATASKEWVIQPKPKPGRKPKKDVPPSPKDVPEVDAKGRRVQNRAAQRAFRERKQSQLAELQARVQSYEQGEIERNVALQNIAKRLKEENEQFRKENMLLKEKISQMENEKCLTRDNDRKRWREESPASTSSLDPPAKKFRVAPQSPHSSLSPLSTGYIPSPPSMVSSPDSNGSSDTFSPSPYDPHPDQSQASLANLLDFPSNAKTANEDSQSFPTFDCGFCSDDTPCVCREIALHHAADRAVMSNSKLEQYTQPGIGVSSTRTLHAPLEPVRPSILENLPAYQPPVPLRRRGGPPVNPIFVVHPAPPSPPQTTVIATCSGDPANCMACADDPFGKAFCSAIEESIASRGPCADCPSRQSDGTCNFDRYSSAPSSMCCGTGLNCERCLSSSMNVSLHSATTVGTKNPETIPTDDAWRQIKAHPNVAFADLSLLADVVASRPKCTGPTLAVSAPATNVPNHTPTSSEDQSDHGPVLLTDPHARYKERAQLLGSSPPPQLVPQEVLIKCGRQRVREVYTDAVRHALRLLDAKFS